MTDSEKIEQNKKDLREFLKLYNRFPYHSPIGLDKTEDYLSKVLCVTTDKGNSFYDSEIRKLVLELMQEISFKENNKKYLIDFIKSNSIKEKDEIEKMIKSLRKSEPEFAKTCEKVFEDCKNKIGEDQMTSTTKKGKKPVIQEKQEVKPDENIIKLENMYPNKTGCIRKIHLLWNNHYRINYHDINNNNYIKDSHFVSF